MKLEENTSNLKGKDLNEVMLDIVPAIFRADCYQNGQINATEIFLYKTTTRIVNSRKVDVTYESYKGNIEIIPSFDIQNGIVKRIDKIKEEIKKLHQTATTKYSSALTYFETQIFE